MKNYLFLFLIIISCNKATQKDNIQAAKPASKKELKKFYDSDKIEHFYLNISEDSILNLLKLKNENKDQKKLRQLLVSDYPDSVSEPNFETDLVKYKFTKTELSELKKKEVEKIFSQQDSTPAEFLSCVPYYRDIFIFKKNDSIVGIAKICFDCGISTFLGSNVDTGEFGLRSELNKLEKIVRNK
ncbi:hypothetical protein CLV94_2398 [Flavobacterium endophyticum]|uniref:Uncharacterized protein n=1 Tax=Flavobacterium endophyticum TaxID=1540163 RepID=A0A495MAK4_9FLAO|nr:hypothetical protein [Flavobacterium endophyticum]RKS21763.1 hypothetical protein CLV94_2398 [Flavobacterium endophyticum]